MPSLHITMRGKFALVTEVNPDTHAERTIIAEPHMLAEGLYLKRLIECQDYAEALIVVDLLHEQLQEQEQAQPCLPITTGSDATVTSTTEREEASDERSG